MHNFKNPKMEILHVFHEGSLKKDIMSFHQKKKKKQEEGPRSYDCSCIGKNLKAKLE